MKSFPKILWIILGKTVNKSDPKICSQVDFEIMRVFNKVFNRRKRRY